MTTRYFAWHAMFVRSSGTAVGRVSDGTTVSSVSVLLHYSSAGTQTSSNPLPAAEELLYPQRQFKPAKFSVQTPMWTEHRACVVWALETSVTNVFCPETLIRLTSLPTQSVQFNLGLSGDPGAVGMALNQRAKAVLFDWIPADNQQCAVRLRDSSKANSRRFDRRNLSVLQA